ETTGGAIDLRLSSMVRKSDQGWRESHREHQQSLVPACRIAHPDDHDRPPAIRVDALRRPDAEADRVGTHRYPVRLRALHPLSDVGAAARRLARRSTGT